MVFIDNNFYKVNDNEFNKIHHKEFNNLKLISDLIMIFCQIQPKMAL